MEKRTIEDCPFCQGDIDGCCFCDHTGKIYVGKNEVFQTVTDLIPIQVDKPLESDLRKVIEREAELKQSTPWTPSQYWPA